MMSLFTAISGFMLLSVQRFLTSRSASNFICGLATCNMELGTVLLSVQRIFGRTGP